MLINKPYNRERAVEYALKWALSRNPLFADFTGIGGNCTNFVSQCILAGSCTMNYTPTFGWYYISLEERAPAWSSVEYFYDFITGVPRFAERNGGIGPYAREVGREEAQLGDVIQYANADGDWYHTVIITGFDGDEILVSAQSDDARNRRLSSYGFADLRVLHIEGVRMDINDDLCFETLLRGEEATQDLQIQQTPPQQEESGASAVSDERPQPPVG